MVWWNARNNKSKTHAKNNKYKVHALEVSLPRLVEGAFPTDLVLRGIVVCFFKIMVQGYSLVKGAVRKTIIKEKKTVY